MKCFAIILISLLFFGCVQTKKKSTKEVYILGSFHNLAAIPGSETLYEKAITKIEPDVIFIEWPTTWFDENGKIKKNYFVPTFKRKRVSVEGLFQGVYDNSDYKGHDSKYIGDYVRTKNVKLVPWDIADRNKITHFEQGSRKLEKHFYENLPKNKNKMTQKAHQKIKSINETLKTCSEKGLAQVNSYTCDKAVAQLYELKEKLLPMLETEKIDTRGLKQGVDWWRRRTKAMAKNLCERLEKVPYKRALLTMGWYHRYHVIRDLRKCPGSFKVKETWGSLDL